MTIGSSGSLLDGAASHLGHPTEGCGGYPDFTVPALQCGLGTQIRSRRSGGAALHYLEPHQITVGTLRDQKAREVYQDVEPKAFSPVEPVTDYVKQYHRHPASGTSSRTVRAG
jgi:hypothetical protein